MSNVDYSSLTKEVLESFHWAKVQDHVPPVETTSDLKYSQ